MRFTILGSGSRGNALVVEAGRTRLLLDCGFGAREMVRRLARAGLPPGSLSGILVTHEHDDHIGGVLAFARRYALPVWLTPGTLRGLEALFAALSGVHLLEGYAALCIGDLEVHPFPVPHDAREPAQYVFGDGRHRLGVVTDLGCPTALVTRMLSGCDALVLECNHDARMLADGDYPPALKQRIASRSGHLDNAAAAGLLAGLDRSRLQHIVAAHLSQSNNRPELARQALAGALGCAQDWVGIADQDAGLDWRALT